MTPTTPPRSRRHALVPLLLAMFAGCAAPSVDTQPVEGELPDPQLETRAIDPDTVVELRAFWSPANGDNAVTTDPTFAPAGYSFYRSEGYVFRPDRAQPPGTRTLFTWFSSSRGDYFTTTNSYWAASVPGTIRDGYTFIRREGFVYDRAVAGTVPLHLRWNSSRADNFSTTDPFWTSSTSAVIQGYGYAETLGHLIPREPSVAPANTDAFHKGTMGGAPRGERDLLVLMANHADEPFRHTTAQVDSLFFGPTYPNVRDYMREASMTNFAWRRAGVVRFNVPDDPETAVDERQWHVLWDVNDSRMAFAFLNGANGTWQAMNGGGSTVSATNTGVDTWETFGVIDFNGGTIQPNDTIAFKTFTGNYFNISSGRVAATATTQSAATRFTVERVSGTGTITNGTQVRLRPAAGQYLRADLTVTSTIADAGVFNFNKAAPDMSRQLRVAVTETGRLGLFNYSPFDRNGDGTIARDELQVAIVGSGDDAIVQDGGGTRNAAPISIPGTTKTLGGGSASGMGEDVSIGTAAHELIHTLGTIDMYGSGTNFRYTLMGATITGTRDDRSVFELDPWHKLKLGWITPRIHSIKANGGSALLQSPNYAGASGLYPAKQPVLLYDPARYDLYNRKGEYFMIELRDASVGGYDANVPSNGFVVWQVETDQFGNPLFVPGVSGGTDRSVNTFGAPSGSRGTGRAWLSSDGTITLRYRDGTDAGVRLRVGNFSAGSGFVEWSNDGVLNARLDSGPASLVPGSTVALHGQLGVDSVGTTVSLWSWYAGTWTNATITSWDGSRAYAQLPPTLPAGTYSFYVRKGGKTSNPLGRYTLP